MLYNSGVVFQLVNEAMKIFFVLLLKKEVLFLEDLARNFREIIVAVL